MSNRISVVVLNWARPRWLRWVILPHLARHPLVDEIIVSHGRRDTAFRFSSRRCRVVHRDDSEGNARYGLSLRFLAARDAAHGAVMLVDDDIIPAHAAVTALARAHARDPDIIQGIFGRGLDAELRYTYDGWTRGPAPMVLTRCLIMKRAYADLFLGETHRVEDMLTRGRPLWNGEDIYLSLLAIRETGRLNRAHDLPFRNIWWMHKRGLSRAAPQEEGVLPHRAYRRWFSAEAAARLGIETQLRELMTAAQETDGGGA